MRISEELKDISKQVEHLEKESLNRLLRCNRLDRAMVTIRLALAGTDGLTSEQMRERIIDALVVSGDPHHPEYWPKYLQPEEVANDG